MSFEHSTKKAAEILQYLKQDCNRQIEKSKWYADKKKGLVRIESDGSVTKESLDLYAKSLDLMGQDATQLAKASKLSERKQIAEIERLEEQGRREKIKRQKEEGLLIPREDVHLELVTRAVHFRRELHNMVKAEVLEFTHLVGGQPDKSPELSRAIIEQIDLALHEFSREIVIEVEIHIDEED